MRSFLNQDTQQVLLKLHSLSAEQVTALQAKRESHGHPPKWAIFPHCDFPTIHYHLG